MAIVKNALTYGFGFNITAAGPVDSRMRVPYSSDLTTVWGSVVDGEFKPNTDAPVYAGMIVVVNETNKAYILKQASDESGLVYDGAGAPVAANPTDINNWVPVGTDFSGDIEDIAQRLDTVEGAIEVAEDSGLTKADGELAVKISSAEGNSLSVSADGLYVSVPEIDVPEYTLESVAGADSAYAAQYQLKKDGVAIGATINIPKDQFLKGATFHSEKEDEATVEAPYLKFVWQLDIDSTTEGDQTITYVPVADLVDTYTTGSHISISSEGAISVDTDSLKQALGIETINSNISSLTTRVGANEASITTINGDLVTLGGRISEVDEKFGDYEIKTASSSDMNGISLLVNPEGQLSLNVNPASIKASLGSYNTGEIKLSEGFGAYNTTDHDLQDVIKDLDSRITIAAAGGMTSVVGGQGVEVVVDKETDPNNVNPTISVNVSEIVDTTTVEAAENNLIAVKTSGIVKVNSGIKVVDNKMSVNMSDLVVEGSSIKVDANGKIDLTWTEL